MHKTQRQVREFHKDVVGGPTSPAVPQIRDANLRARLILEEAAETAAALLGRDAAAALIDEFAAKTRDCGLKKPDLAEAVDGVCDLVYVAYGTAEALGVDLEPYFDAVHRSNMAKAGDAVDEHGKKGRKPEGWRPPTEEIVRLLGLDAAAAAGRSAETAPNQVFAVVRWEDALVMVERRGAYALPGVSVGFGETPHAAAARVVATKVDRECALEPAPFFAETRGETTTWVYRGRLLARPPSQWTTLHGWCGVVPIERASEAHYKSTEELDLFERAMLSFGVRTFYAVQGGDGTWLSSAEPRSWSSRERLSFKSRPSAQAVADSLLEQCPGVRVVATGVVERP